MQTPGVVSARCCNVFTGFFSQAANVLVGNYRLWVALVVCVLALDTRAQVLLDKNDYGPVISSNVWYGSRLPGLTCNMPKARQVSVPICPDCVVVEVRPHMDNPNLVVMELTSPNSLNKLADHFDAQPGMSAVRTSSDQRKQYFAGQQYKNLSATAFELAKPQIPYALLEDVAGQFGSNRRVTLVTEHDDSYRCVFDHNG